MTFPKDFVWGAATASYQIEGAVNADGRGDSVWDSYCRRPGAVWEKQSGEVACDHYHRWREDVDLMKQIGLTGYRFSIAWPRVMPEGAGQVNPKGLDFYSRLVDALLAAGVEPWPTLFHWDYPQALFDRGGWLSPDSPQWFADYTAAVVDKLSDRVSHWFTLNEPQCFILFGHRDGIQAPGLKLSRREVLRAAHHSMLAHGRAVQVIRQRSAQPAQVGIAHVGWSFIPATDSEADIAAARDMTFSTVETQRLDNAWWMDPVYLGRYPEQALQFYGADAPKVRDGDMETICQPLDVQAFNTYEGQLVRAGADGRPEVIPQPTGVARAHMGGPVTPDSLYWNAKFFHERYGLPIVVSENGTSNTDWVMTDGRCRDPQRIDLLRRYLRAFERAGDEGVPIRGYFQWSLMDNFEWGHGFKFRFGLIHVDYVTQQRTLKDSALWYRDVIASNGAKIRDD